MRYRWAVLVTLRLLSCGEKNYTPDECRALQATFVQRCMSGDLEHGQYVGDLKCWPFSKPERMHGVWVRTSEESVFAPNASKVTRDAPANQVWLATDFSPRLGDDFARGYLVDFVGRRTLCEGNYGRTGAEKGAVIVDKFLSLRRLAMPSS